MQFDFNKVLVNLNGEPLKNEKGEDQTAGKLLASALVNTNKGDAMKFMQWGQKMWNCEVIDLDKSVKKTLSDFIEHNEQLTNLAKAQLLDILNETNS